MSNTCPFCSKPCGNDHCAYNQKIWVSILMIGKRSYYQGFRRASDLAFNSEDEPETVIQDEQVYMLGII